MQPSSQRQPTPRLHIVMYFAFLSLLVLVFGLNLRLSRQSAELRQQSSKIQQINQRLIEEEDATPAHFKETDAIYYGSNGPTTLQDTSQWNKGDWKRYKKRLEDDRFYYKHPYPNETPEAFQQRRRTMVEGGFEP